MSRIVISAWLIFSMMACSHSPKKKAAGDLAYTLEPTVFKNAPALAVTLSFRGETSGETYLELPDRWAGQTELYKDIHEFRVLSPGASYVAGESPHLRKILHPPGALLTVSYVAVSAPPPTHHYRPLIQPHAFRFIGNTVFAIPNWEGDKPFQIDITWKNFPPNFKIVNSFGVEELTQTLSRSLDDFRHAIYVGGDYRLSQLSIADQPVMVAIRGAWKFKDEEFIELVRRVFQFQRDFWQDYQFPYYVVTLSENGEDCCSRSGTHLSQSFALFVAADTTVDEQMIHLLQHELFHTWNGGKIRGADPEELLYWFSEGFTNYFDRLLSLRSGLYSLPQYVHDLNETLYRNAYSPVALAPNERIKSDFWKNRDIEKLPYHRGDFLAHYWNARLHAKAKVSLDDFMKQHIKRLHAENQKNSFHAVDKTLRQWLPDGVEKELKEYIIQGKPIPMPAHLGPCVTLIMKKIGKFERGYDSEKTYATQVFSGVQKNSAAFRAGLRDGQKLLDRRVEDFPVIPSRIKIADAQGERWIEFFTESFSKKSVPQYQIDEKKLKANPQACLAWFGAEAAPDRL